MVKYKDQLTVRQLGELFSIHHDYHRSSDLYCNLASTCTHMNNPLIGLKRLQLMKTVFVLKKVRKTLFCNRKFVESK